MTSTSSFPYIHISCPCAEDTPAPIQQIPRSPTKRDSSHGDDPFRSPVKTAPRQAYNNIPIGGGEDDEEQEDVTFDPLNPRSAFSLFPIENLLYCEDCRQIRCPRCVQDEIVCWFCPSCLFEVPSSTIKSDGNRCTRNCFHCPICSSLLSVTSIGTPSAGSEAPAGPFTLSCYHCHWTTTELSPSIKFDKPTSLSSQLQKLAPSAQSVEFAKLKNHYAEELGNVQEDYTGSPAALSRLMGMYTGIGSSPSGMGRKSRVNKQASEMREIDRMREVNENDERLLIERMARMGYGQTTSSAQRLYQTHNPRFLEELKPIATLLRTKRSKRCRACRHILVKPESKVQTTRFRIRLVALNYIPRLTLQRHDPTIQYTSLIPHKTHRFILIVTNPLFDPISVSLLTPSHIPGFIDHSRVTILCSEFDVGANTDVWEESLLVSTERASSNAISKQKGVVGSNSSGGNPSASGEIYEKGRNHTSVIIEVVPPEANEEEDQNDKVVEVPVLVRIKYEMDAGEESGAGGAGKEKVEYSYWTVIGVGMVGEPVEGVVESAPGTPAYGTPIKKRVK